MMPKSVFGVVFVIIAIIAAVCVLERPRSVTFRYKITLTLDTPDGPKIGSSVVETRIYQETWGPSGPLFGDSDGEAVYVNLGESHRPLVALLTDSIKANRSRNWVWTNGPSRTFLLKLYGLKASQSDYSDSYNYLNDYNRLASEPGSREIPFADLPDLVTFSNIADPKTIIEVSPYDLQATLGPRITLRSATFEFTHDPVTKAISSKLRFLDKWICQKNYDFNQRRISVYSIGFWSFKEWFDYYERHTGIPRQTDELREKCPPRG